MSNSLSPIKFIYFDVGGVVIQDFSCTNNFDQMLIDLGLNESNDLELFYQLYHQHEAQLAKGNMSLEQFFSLLMSYLNFTPPPNYSFMHDLIIRFSPNPSLWPIFYKLRQKQLKLGLLTNMYLGMFPQLQQANLLPDFDWDVIVDSSLVHLFKPEPEIYHYAQQQAGVPSDQILFIDNLSENLDAAVKLGFQTFLYSSCNYSQSTQQLTNFLHQQKLL